MPYRFTHLPKILIIRFSSIGDIVLTTPVIRCIKKQIAKAEVHVLTKKNYGNILAPNPYVDKVYATDGSLKDVLTSLKNEKYDYVIDLHRNLRSLRVKLLLNKKSFSFDKLNFEKWLLVNFGINRLPDTHIVERYFETVKSFRVQNDGEGLDFFIREEDEINWVSLPLSHQHGYIGIVIGAKHTTKKLPLQKLITLCKALNHPIMLLGGKEDVTNANSIAESVGSTIYNACGKYNLGQSASLVKQAAVIITHDTGLMHIAAAFRKKIISIWGNTVPEFGMYPYLPTSFTQGAAIIETTNLPCRPCSKIGYDKCPLHHFDCMNKISTDEIVWLTKKNLMD